MGDPGDEAAGVMQRPLRGVVESSFDIFVLSKILGEEHRRTWVPCGRAKAGSNRKNPSFRNHVFPIRNADVGRSVVAGPTKNFSPMKKGRRETAPPKTKGGERQHQPRG